MAAVGLTVYMRVLAPDVLYSDSSEFQTLAYTWATTHTTGYPVYLLLARIVSLLPVETLAWRVNFASAVFAAVTLGGVFLIARYFTGRGGALLASLILLLSYTFWSQSIIAEVYTLAPALIVIVLLMLLRWHEQPLKRRWLVFAAGFLLGVGLGAHLFVLLIAPPAFVFVLWSVRRDGWQPAARLIAGGVVGAACFFGLFAFMDTRPTPTNIFTTTIIPSREVWGLQDSDLDSVPERFWISVSGYQWRSRMLPSDVDYGETLKSFVEVDLAREFVLPAVLLALVGVLAALLTSRRLFALLGGGLLIAFAAGFLYFPGDKFIFYLPFYLLLAIFSGIGAGTLTSLVVERLPTPNHLSAIAITALLIAVCAAPFAGSRWRAIQRGQSGFIREEYVYPVAQPSQPRAAAECALSMVTEEDALLVLDWRALYSIYYIAHVEQNRTGIIIHEAQPYPAQMVAPSLRAEITERLQNGQAVYVDNPYQPLTTLYDFAPVRGSCFQYRLFRLSLPG